MKKKSLSTRDALLSLRETVSADADKAARIEELVKELNETVNDRSRCLEAALGTLEGYVALHSEMHGFNSDLEELAVSASRQTKKAGNLVKARAAKAAKVSKKKVAKKQKRNTGRNGGRNGGPQKALGYPGQLVGSINLSPREQSIVDVLTARWPTFTTPQTLTRKGIVPKPNHVPASINRMRKKGVPIESAKQARKNDPELSSKTRGYRLVD